MKVKVIGAGLAGSEAAWQLAQRGVEVAPSRGIETLLIFTPFVQNVELHMIT